MTSYVPVSRGLRDHLAEMSGNAVKLYLELLLSAAFAGPNKGQVAVTFADLALTLGLHKQSVHKAARELRPYFIDWKAATNQHSVTVFTIQRYKSIRDFAVSRRTHSKNLPYEKITQRVDSTLTAPPVDESKDSHLPVPNKLEKLDNKAAAAFLPKTENSVWSFLGISPCGPSPFRSLLESRWASRNGERVSLLIGETVDAWETADGGKLRGVRDLFRALARLREAEKETKPQTGSGEPIHVITPEEIPV